MKIHGAQVWGCVFWGTKHPQRQAALHPSLRGCAAPSHLCSSLWIDSNSLFVTSTPSKFSLPKASLPHSGKGGGGRREHRRSRRGGVSPPSIKAFLYISLVRMGSHDHSALWDGLGKPVNSFSSPYWRDTQKSEWRWKSDQPAQGWGVGGVCGG